MNTITSFTASDMYSAVLRSGQFSILKKKEDNNVNKMKDELLIPDDMKIKDQQKTNNSSQVSINISEVMNSFNQLSPKKFSNLSLSPNKSHVGNSSLQTSPTSPKMEKRARSHTVSHLNGSNSHLADISNIKLSPQNSRQRNNSVGNYSMAELRLNEGSQYRKTPMRSHSSGQHGHYQNRKSWRLSIFNRVAAPTKFRGSDVNYNIIGTDNIIRRKLSQKEVRALWKKAILETLLLIRMEKENINLQEHFILYGSRSVVVFKARQDAAEMKRLKLDYKEIIPCLKDVTFEWDEILSSSDNDKIDIPSIVRRGVPQAKRGDIWQYLIKNYTTKETNDSDTTPLPEHYFTPYEDLLKQLTTHQHAILIDLGRTFPTHPYFSRELGVGQLSMFNLLKAYSLVDREVGYCQGLSFIAGIFLMHLKEDQAFEALKFIMYKLNVRRQYRPEMTQLQTQMYMLSRLLHDHHRDLYEHFESNEIVPSLYATAWFLTLFASEFPLGFVSRVFDLLLLYGQEIIFKVALILLGNHKELIKDANSLETIVKFLKETLPEMGMIQMERVINQVYELDISKQLATYEIEYQVLQDEMLSPANTDETDSLCISELEKTNHNVQQQNMLLTEQLCAANSTSHELAAHCSQYASQVVTFNETIDVLKSHIYSLELERAVMLHTLNHFKELYPDIQLPPFSPSKTLDDNIIHNPSVNELIEKNEFKIDHSAPFYADIIKSSNNQLVKLHDKFNHIT